MKILIGGAWPYSNYKLHLGNAAGIIGGDLLARYHRAKGDDVIYVSGSDCHGTPITERAKKEGITPAEISNKYHKLFVEAFNALNFSYDLYTETETDYHKSHVMEIVKKIYDNGGSTGEHLTRMGTAVFVSEPNAEHRKKLEKRGLKVMLLEELESKLK